VLFSYFSFGADDGHNNATTRNAVAAIVSLALLFAGLWAPLLAIERWAALSFAKAHLGAMLVAVLDVGVFIAALCLAPAISQALGFLLGVRARARASLPTVTRMSLAGAAAAAAVFLADLAGWRANDNSATGSFATSALIGLAFSTLGGLLSGAMVWLLAILARKPGPAAVLTVRPIANASKSPLILGASLAAAGIVLAAAVPARTALHGRLRISASVDLVALLAAFAAFVFASRFVQRFQGSMRGSWRSIGGSLVIAGVAGCAAAGFWRPYLLSTGLLELVHIANFSMFGAGAWILLPDTAPVVRRALACLILALGISTLVGAQLSEKFRPRLAMEIRPSSWLLVELPSKIDFDNDGYSPLFGGDCNDSDPFINPSAAEIPGNGIDDNCRGGDKLVKLPWKPRPSFVQLPPAEQQPKRVLLLVVDALRADHVSCYGYKKNTSPNIDLLAERGVRFTNAYSASPLTRYAFPILFTGRLGPEIFWDRDEYRHRLRKENTMVAEVMREAGFKTAAFLTFYVMTETSGYLQGFDYIDKSLARTWGRIKDDSSSELLVDLTLEWIEKHQNDKSFIFVHFMDVHHDYVPHEGIPDFGKDLKGLYDGEIFFADRAIGRLLARMTEFGLDGDTAIVLMADHGEMLGEHGCRLHGKNVWQEVLRIPLIFVSPGIKPGLAPCVTSHVDVAPTILNLVGIDGGKHGMTSSTLVPDLLGSCDAEREIVVELKDYRALVGPRYKVIYNTRARNFDLYDIVDDPGEKHDLSKEKPGLFKQTRDRLLAWEEYRASKHVVEALDKAIVDRVPPGARRLNAVFPNGIEILAADLGKRWISRKEPLQIAMYLRMNQRVTQSCRVEILCKKDKRSLSIRGAGAHEPVKGTLPFRYFPLNKVVEDFHYLAWGGKAGRCQLSTALLCDGKHVGALPGGNVINNGWVNLGKITVSKKNAGSPPK
jgi:choline-sulfatase